MSDESEGMVTTESRSDAKGKAAPEATHWEPVRLVAALLAAVAFAGSFDHVRQTVADHGQAGWLPWAIAAMPELMVGLCVLKFRRRQADGWTWAVGISSVAFTLSANLAQAERSPWGWVAAGWPAWAAVSSVMLLEAGPAATLGARPKAQGAERDAAKARAKPSPAAAPPAAAEPHPEPRAHEEAHPARLAAVPSPDELDRAPDVEELIRLASLLDLGPKEIRERIEARGWGELDGTSRATITRKKAQHREAAGLAAAS